VLFLTTFCTFVSEFSTVSTPVGRSVAILAVRCKR